MACELVTAVNYIGMFLLHCARCYVIHALNSVKSINLLADLIKLSAEMVFLHAFLLRRCSFDEEKWSSLFDEEKVL